MEATEIIDEHLVIRATVGYDFIKEIERCDLPNVLKFLKIVWNYEKLCEVEKESPLEAKG